MCNRAPHLSASMSTNARSCDACRVAKVRCIAQPRSVDDVASAFPCERCMTHNRLCTFNLPVRRRGPKSKYVTLAFIVFRYIWYADRACVPSTGRIGPSRRPSQPSASPTGRCPVPARPPTTLAQQRDTIPQSTLLRFQATILRLRQPLSPAMHRAGCSRRTESARGIYSMS